MGCKKRTVVQAANETSRMVEGLRSQKDSDFVDTRGENLKVPDTSWTQDMEDMLVRTLVKGIRMGCEL